MRRRMGQARGTRQLSPGPAPPRLAAAARLLQLSLAAVAEGGPELGGHHAQPAAGQGGREIATRAGGSSQFLCWRRAHNPAQQAFPASAPCGLGQLSVVVVGVHLLHREASRHVAQRGPGQAASHAGQHAGCHLSNPHLHFKPCLLHGGSEHAVVRLVLLPDLFGGRGQRGKPERAVGDTIPQAQRPRTCRARSNSG